MSTQLQFNPIFSPNQKFKINLIHFPKHINILASFFRVHKTPFFNRKSQIFCYKTRFGIYFGGGPLLGGCGFVNYHNFQNG
jgi:hypothetical protein